MAPEPRGYWRFRGAEWPGRISTRGELAEGEQLKPSLLCIFAPAGKISASSISRVLRLTLLAPDIVEAILDGRQPAEMTRAGLMRPVAVGWDAQRSVLVVV